MSEPPDFTTRFNTVLSPAAEARFRAAYPDARDLFDYDLRGHFQKSGGKRGAGHLTDEFKKPNHRTFSTESRYHGQGGFAGGEWREEPGGSWSFAASPTNLQMSSPEDLQQYFATVEKGNRLILPQSKKAGAMKQIKVDGVVHNFPDDATDAEISAILNAPQPRQTMSPKGRPAMPKRQSMDWIDRNIGVPLGIVDTDPMTGGAVRKESPVSVVADPLAQGATLGYMDEAEALGGASGAWLKQQFTGTNLKDLIVGTKPKSFADLYNAAVEQRRAVRAAQHEAHPVIDTTLQIAGGLAVGTPASSAISTPVTLGQAVKTGAAYGGAYGGAAGFGSGEGGLESRLASAAVGGALGGATGAALPLAITGLSKIWQAGKNALNLNDPEKQAQTLILRALERDKMTPEQALAQYQGWRASGAKPEALMDLGGENMRRLARDVISVPGQSAEVANKFLNERQAGQGDRVLGDLSKYMPDDAFYGTLDDLAKTRSESAAPIYDEAYRAAGEVWSDDLARLGSRPSMKAAWARARKLAAEQDRTLPNVFKENATEGLENIPGKMPTLEAWDYMKQGLDDLLETYRNPTTGKLVLDKQGRAINETRKQLVAALDAEVEKKTGASIYATARNQWAGPSQSMDAIKLGEDFISKDAEITAKMLDGMGDSEKQFFRIGVTKAIKDRVEKMPDGADVVKRIFNTPAIRNKLRAAFPDFASFSEFEGLMRREAAMYSAATKARGGSRTAEVLAGQKELTTEPGFLTNLFTGQWAAAARQGVGNVMRRGQGMSQGVSDRLADLLFTADPVAIQSTAGALARQRAAQAARLAATQRSTAGATRFGAGLLGRTSGALTNYNQE